MANPTRGRPRGRPMRVRGQQTKVQKKTVRLDQNLLDEARRALGARTETEVITHALEAVVQRERQAEGLRTLASFGPIDERRISD